MVSLPPGVHRVPGEAFAVDPAKPWLRYYPDLDQGSQAWLDARCGLVTASEMKLLLTPTLKVADNDKTRAHLWELLAQRVTRFVEPRYISDDMLRGQEDEIYARAAYEEAYGPMASMGFITNSRWGFIIGYSPDGLIGDRGLWECKSRAQKYQAQTIAECAVPAEYMLQLQTGLLVTGREWIDFTSYCGGMPMLTLRVYPDERVQEAMLEAVAAFEERLADLRGRYEANLADPSIRTIPTERRVMEEITI